MRVALFAVSVGFMAHAAFAQPAPAPAPQSTPPGEEEYLFRSADGQTHLNRDYLWRPHSDVMNLKDISREVVVAPKRECWRYDDSKFVINLVRFTCGEMQVP